MTVQTPPVAPEVQGTGRRRKGRMVAGGILCVLAVVLLAGGGWALWTDRLERDAGGFLSTGTLRMDTDTYAIVSETRGDGPSWLYGPAVLGDTRVRVTSQNEQPVFVGIARTEDVSRYLDGAGYATIEHFQTSDGTTHEGRAPTYPPAQTSIWATSSEGTGQQVLHWDARDGNWSIVLMNAEAGAGVEVRGDLGAEVPILPWLTGALLIAAVASGLVGAWLLTRAIPA